MFTKSETKVEDKPISFGRVRIDIRRKRSFEKIASWRAEEEK